MWQLAYLGADQKRKCRRIDILIIIGDDGLPDDLVAVLWVGAVGRFFWMLDMQQSRIIQFGPRLIDYLQSK